MKRSNYITIAAAVAAFLTAGSALGEDVLVRLQQADAVKAAISRVEPVYPPMARQLHIEGSVSVQAVIDEEGKVQSVKTVTGNPILSSAASEALKKWKFTPFEAEGKVHKAVTDITFAFKM